MDSSVRVPKEFAEFLALIEWVDRHTAQLELSLDERSQLAIGCFDVALEHGAAMALLHQSELHGSMLALARSLSEAVIRGLWLLLCAKDTDLEKFKRQKKLDLKFSVIVAELETHFASDNKILAGFKLSAWSQLCDFAHTGYLQISRRHKPGRVEGSYPDEDLKNVLGAAGAFTLIAGMQVVALAERNDLIAPFFERMRAFADKPKP